MEPLELGMVLLSAALHALWNTATKGSRDPLAYMLLLELGSALLLLPLLFFCDLSSLPAELWALLALTGVAHSLYAYWLARGYAHGDLTVVYPISRSTPALVPLLAIPWFGESISLPGAIGIGLVLIGIWGVSTGGSLRWRQLLAPGAAFAVLTLLATVGYSLLDKQGMVLLSELPWTGATPRSMAFYVLIMIAHTPPFALLASRHIRWPDLIRQARAESRAVIGGVIAAFASYALILEALRTAQVSYVVTVRQASVVFAVGLAIFWLREKPGRARVLAALSTVFGVVIVSLYG